MNAASWRIYRALVAQDLRFRVLGSRLGLLWLILQPLLYLSFTTVVFFAVLGVRLGPGGVWEYAMGLLAGLVAWLAFSEGLGKAAPSLLERSYLLRNVPIPRWVVPLVPVAAALLYQGVCLTGVIGACAFRGTLGPGFWQIIPALFFEALLLCGFAWALSAVTVLFRDAQYLLNFALMAWLYLTPIFWPAHVVPDRLAALLVYLNPLALLVVLFRGALLGDPIPPNVWTTLAVLSVLVLGLGYLFFRRIEDVVADFL
ncbi:MAG: ABC transporter permease [Bdellovibrionota bacterium]